MHTTLATLIDRLDSTAVSNTNVIHWGCPVPSFGDLSKSRVATLGLNPSNREFMDESGRELDGAVRRFPTLRSLGIGSWSNVNASHLRLIIGSCRDYFRGNPYDRWFRRLDGVLSGTNASYYNGSRSACHLDLIPYATEQKWAELAPQQRTCLLGVAGDTLGLLLRNSPVRLLILNGRSVVEQFQDIAAVRLDSEEQPTWLLPRQSGAGVMGIAYKGLVDTLSGVALEKPVQVLGFNHNLQSSFGVTNEVIYAIRDWITKESNEVLC